MMKALLWGFVSWGQWAGGGGSWIGGGGGDGEEGKKREDWLT